MDLSALRILVVDDNPQAAEIVKSILASLGAAGRHASTAHDAYRILQEDAIDIVIVDQNLGAGGEGIQLIRRIRRDPSSATPYVPIVMLTGYADERRVRAARDVGVNEFLVKPFTVTGLLRRIEALIYQPRVFIRSPDYFGPDRRRRADPRYTGAERRRANKIHTI